MAHSPPVRTAIIGAGLQCRRRAPVVVESPDAELTVIAAEHLDHAESMAKTFGCRATRDWQEVAERDDVDVVIVATPPHLHAEIGIAAMRAGKDVLCEKPLTRTVEEAEELVAAARETGRVLKCGFNHRYHPAIWAAHQMLERGELGRPLFARCRYGICGRPGFEKEWRADPARAAGGQLFEQGIHGMDLFRWFLGEPEQVACMTSNHYFKDMPLDDGGMALYRMRDGATATLHSTLVQWQNLFSFEVYGEEGYASIEGLGSSYGNERLITGKRDFDAPFQDVITHFRGGDKSWQAEWQEFVVAVTEGKPIANGTPEDGLRSMRMAAAAYESERSGTILSIQSQA